MIKLISSVHNNDIPGNAQSMKRKILNVQSLREEKFKN